MPSAFRPALWSRSVALGRSVMRSCRSVSRYLRHRERCVGGQASAFRTALGMGPRPVACLLGSAPLSCNRPLIPSSAFALARLAISVRHKEPTSSTMISLLPLFSACLRSFLGLSITCRASGIDHSQGQGSCGESIWRIPMPGTMTCRRNLISPPTHQIVRGFPRLSRP